MRFKNISRVTYPSDRPYQKQTKNTYHSFRVMVKIQDKFRSRTTRPQLISIYFTKGQSILISSFLAAEREAKKNQNNLLTEQNRNVDIKLLSILSFLTSSHLSTDIDRFSPETLLYITIWDGTDKFFTKHKL